MPRLLLTLLLFLFALTGGAASAFSRPATRGGITRSLALTLHGQQESETWTGGPLDGLAVDPGSDALRRRNALAVTGPGGSVPAAGYTYDALTGELASIASGTASAAYAYRTGTRQVESVAWASSPQSPLLTQTRTYDDLHRLTGVTSQNGAPLAASGYALDAAGRRSRTVLTDGTWWKYLYGDFGQVIAAERHRMAGAAPDDSDPVIPGQSFAYAYDGLGNRTSAIQGGGGVTADAALTYTPAASNQYATVANNRTGLATGSADPAATVTVNSAAAPRAGPWWGQSETTAAGSSAAWLNFSIDATLGGNTDHTDTALLVPPSSLSPVYDAAGNLTDDGLRTFTWDADSRLLSVTTKDTLLPAAAPMYRVSYQYDDGGRRIAQTVEARTVSGGVYVLVNRRCFLYDGWSCIAEPSRGTEARQTKRSEARKGEGRKRSGPHQYDYAPAGTGATRTLYRTQVWGQSLAPGGAGGLLAISRHTGPLTGTHCATHDGNGNVTALVDANTGTESARYDYDPYGNLLRATGDFAAENPYRFSTQFTDDVTGLLYYGYRHYDPLQGRWLSRDPIGEAGGQNLYGFIGNDPVNDTDMLGMVSDDEVTGASWAVKRTISSINLTLQAMQDRRLLHEEYGGDYYRKIWCESWEEYQRLNALLPGQRDAMQALLKEYLQEQIGADGLDRFLGNSFFNKHTLGNYEEAMAELAAAHQEGAFLQDMWSQAFAQHDSIRDLARLLGNELDDYNAVLAAADIGSKALLQGSLAILTGPTAFLAGTGGYYGARALGASEGVATVVGIATGISAGVAIRPSLSTGSGFGATGLYRAPIGTADGGVRAAYIAEAASTSFRAKLVIHNLLTPGRTWVTPTMIQQRVAAGQFGLGAFSVTRSTQTGQFLFGGTGARTFLNRQFYHHELIHVSQMVKNPNLWSTFPLRLVHEPIQLLTAHGAIGWPAAALYVHLITRQ